MEDQFIICRKCKHHNETSKENCTQCGSDLLPGKSITDRLIYFAIGIVCLVISLLMYRISFALGFWIGFPMILAFGYCLFVAVSGTTTKTRHEERGDRHKKDCPQQAIADYSKAIELAKSKFTLIEKRGDYFNELKQYDLALSDYEELKVLKKDDEKYLSKINDKIRKINNLINVEQ
ncbi:hypothetical protein ACFLS4_04410 [Bacteroidota bacterium]